MLNEKPKKEKKKKDYSNPTKMQLFWRIQKECLRRSVTVYLMYLFMGLLMLVCQAIDTDATTWLEAGLGLACLLGGMAFNAHLCYSFGEDHYDNYLTGRLHRQNELFGLPSGGDHHPEKEFRVWKGFLIGFYTGLIVIPFGLLAGSFYGTTGGAFAQLALMMFAGWAIIPISWLRDLLGFAEISFYWTIAFALVPIVVSGVFYLIGAMRERKKKLEERERRAAAEAAAEAARNEVRVQTEEQRKKTLQSKKKKK